MKIEQVAAQLYTLRDFTKTAEDIARTLEKVAASLKQSFDYIAKHLVT